MMEAKTTTLWAITDELAEVGALIADNEGELTPDLEARLDALEGALEEKVERIALFIRESETLADGAKSEKERLYAIEKAHRRKADGLKEYLLRCMSGAGRERVETARARVRLQKSGTPSIDYHGDLDALPADFVRVVPESRVLDKKAITQAIRDGETPPEGVTVSYSTSVRIN
jgi:hypothetical protein